MRGWIRARAATGLVVLVTLGLSACSSTAQPADAGVDTLVVDLIAPDIKPPDAGPCRYPNKTSWRVVELPAGKRALLMRSLADGRSLIVREDRITLIGYDVEKSVALSGNPLFAEWFNGELLVGNDVGEFSVYDETLQLLRSFSQPEGRGCDTSTRLDDKLLLCRTIGLHTGFDVYDTQAGKHVIRTDVPMGGYILHRVDARRVATFDNSAYALTVTENGIVEKTCAVANSPIVEGFKLLHPDENAFLGADGAYYAPWGTDCNATPTDFFQPTGKTASFLTPEPGETLRLRHGEVGEAHLLLNVESTTMTADNKQVKGHWLFLVDRSSGQLIKRVSVGGDLGQDMVRVHYNEACNYALIDDDSQIFRVYF